MIDCDADVVTYFGYVRHATATVCACKAMVELRFVCDRYAIANGFPYELSHSCYDAAKRLVCPKVVCHTKKVVMVICYQARK